MSARKLEDSLGNLGRAVANLERALLVSTEGELVFEGTIHRFEITIELVWKTLKRALEFEGLNPRTPRESVKERSASAGCMTKPRGSICWTIGTRPRIPICRTSLSKRIIGISYRLRRLSERPSSS